MNRRGFFKGLFGAGAAIGAAAVTKALPDVKPVEAVAVPVVPSETITSAQFVRGWVTPVPSELITSVRLEPVTSLHFYDGVRWTRKPHIMWRYTDNSTCSVLSTSCFVMSTSVGD